MKPLTKIINGLIVILFIYTSLFTLSCKKEPLIDVKDPISSSAAADGYEIRADPRDSAYFWTKEYYLWTELLPSFEEFNPRSLPDIFAVMAKVRTYQPLDRFSFAERKSDPVIPTTDRIVDMGLSVKFFSNARDLRVNFVNPESPAGLAGIKRGWKILSIDGRTVNADTQAEIDFLNDVFKGTTPVHTFRFQKPDSSVSDLVIREGVYTSRSVLHHSIIQEGNKRVGYLVYNQFGRAPSVIELQNALSHFESEGINDLIVDLRYNRGGFISTAEAFANLLAPMSVGAGRQVMFRYVFNSRHQELNQTVHFNKMGTLNLPRIVFIVTPSTASASEVLINSLKPVMEVYLVGERHTYGKPVGFFPISVFEYNIYPVSFKTVNSLGTADYYHGFRVDREAADDLTYEFGDTKEASLSEALAFLSGTRRPDTRILSAATWRLEESNLKLENRRPALTIEDRPKLMPKINQLK